MLLVVYQKTDNPGSRYETRSDIHNSESESPRQLRYIYVEICCGLYLFKRYFERI